VAAVGCAFRVPGQGHVWFVLSAADASGKILCVNLTTLDDECPDDECILMHVDYEWIEENHPTAVAFSRAKLWDEAKLDQALANGLLNQPNPPALLPATIAKVQAAAKTSYQLSRAFKAML